MVFRSPVVGKWQTLGDDGNEFDRSSEGRAEAWREAQAAANLGMPWAGATFRLVDPFEGDHRDDCVLGLDAEAWCDCGVELAVVEERVVMPDKPNEWESAEAIRARMDAPLSPEQRKAIGIDPTPAVDYRPSYREEDAFVKIGFGAPYGRFGARAAELGPLVVETTGEASAAPDGKATVELSRLSPAKVAELWTGRDAQLQVLSNVLHGRPVSREQRHLIKERMKGRPLGQLAVVVAEVLS